MYAGDALSEHAICSPTARFPWGKSPNALAIRSKPPSPKPSSRRRGSRPPPGELRNSQTLAATSLSNNLAQAEARAPQADPRHQRSARCRIRHEKPTILDKNRRLRGSPLPSGTPTPPRGRKTRGERPTAPPCGLSISPFASTHPPQTAFFVQKSLDCVSAGILPRARPRPHDAQLAPL